MKTQRSPIKQVKRVGLLLFTGLLLSSSSFAQGLKVAAAANLQSIIEVLQKDFKQKTGIDIDPIVGSSGKLVAQIKNGAPFDVFLSADMSFPTALYKESFSAKEPVVYAYGSLIICSNQDIGFENWERILLTERIKKIAIANPAVAPYGLAAEELLKKKGILDNVKNKMVYGESISQVNTYITTGVVQVGFTTQALVKDPLNKTKLYWKLIDPKTYTPIEQGMVILKHAENNPDAEKFYQYILSADAKHIFEKYGYRINN
ncbi:MAG: molybdate transport system substrate-binding protein [Mucilaginibacter sp.]|nr:molybdate transport system substrate-binding protein [Mucilaginibacter sp.]